MADRHLACAARRDYLPHAAAMLHSVLPRAGGRRVHVHLLHGRDVGRRPLAQLAGMVERLGGVLRPHPVAAERVRDLRTRSFLPASHWYRVFLPELLPDVERLLYLDADTIAVDGLDPLWRTDLRGHLLGAVTNVWQEDHRIHPERLGVAPDTYFNTGVLLMDLEGLRTAGATDAVLAYAREHHEALKLPEQDALNVVLGDRRLPLHPRWNVMNSVLAFPRAAEVFGAGELEEARRRPAIRHFEGPAENKPWHAACAHDLRRLYFEHRRGTPWPRVRLEGRSPLARLRRGAAAARTRP